MWLYIRTISRKLTIINPRVNYFKAARMIQTKIDAQQDSSHSIQVCLYFHSRKPLKNPQGNKDHIATTFNSIMPHGNKRAYILWQTCSRKLQVSLSVYNIKFWYHLGWTWVIKEQSMYQNQSQNLSKIWSSGTYFSL